MKIDIHALEVIEAISEQGSFASAAKKLHKVPSAITYTVKKLEDDLGLVLFDKTGHRAKLTSIGHEFLKQARIILTQCQQLENHLHAFQGGWEDVLNVSYNDLIPIETLIPVIKEFQKACPHTSLNLMAERLNGTIESVIGGHADLCIGVSRDAPIRSGFSHFNIGVIQFDFALNPDHPLAQIDAALSEAQIREYPAIVATDTAVSMSKRVAGIISGQQSITVNSIESKKALQIAGLGVGFLPRIMIQEELNQGLLVIRPVANMKPILTLSVLWRTEPAGKALTWLVNYLQNHGDMIVNMGVSN